MERQFRPNIIGEFCVGRRVKILFIDDCSTSVSNLQKYSILQASPDQRTGLVARLTTADITISLDNPLNEEANSIEKATHRLYGIPVSFLFGCKIGELGYRVLIETCDENNIDTYFNASENYKVHCKFDPCATPVISKAQSIMTCLQDRHIICKKHLLGRFIDESTGSLTTETKSVLRVIRKHSKWLDYLSNNAEAVDMNTRLLLAFEKYAHSSTNDSISKFCSSIAIENAMKMCFTHCKVCCNISKKFQYDQNVATKIDVAFLHFQLFPDDNKTLSLSNLRNYTHTTQLSGSEDARMAIKEEPINLNHLQEYEAFKSSRSSFYEMLKKHGCTDIEIAFALEGISRNDSFLVSAETIIEVINARRRSLNAALLDRSIDFCDVNLVDFKCNNDLADLSILDNVRNHCDLLSNDGYLQRLRLSRQSISTETVQNQNHLSTLPTVTALENAKRTEKDDQELIKIMDEVFTKKYPAKFQQLCSEGYSALEIAYAVDVLVSDKVVGLSFDTTEMRQLMKARKESLIIDESSNIKTTSLHSHGDQNKCKTSRVMRITLCCPEDNSKEKSLLLYPGDQDTISHLIHFAMQTFPVMGAAENIMLYVDEMNQDFLTTTNRSHPKTEIDGMWRKELQSQFDISPDTVLLSNVLAEGDVVTVWRTVGSSVGPKVRIETVLSVSERHIMYDKYSLLQSRYLGFRRIRGDGNCYYRAVIFGLLEEIIVSPSPRRRFQKLHDRISTSFNRYCRAESRRRESLDSNSEEDSERRDSRQAFKVVGCILEKAIEGKMFADVNHLEETMLNMNTTADLAFVKVCKCLVADYLDSNKESEMNGLPLKDAILLLQENVKSMQDFCAKYVLRMGVDAEGAFVELGLLPISLGCSCDIVYLDRSKGPDLFIVASAVVQIPLGHVHLLLRPGHYDLLYPRSQDAKVQQDDENLSGLNYSTIDKNKDFQRHPISFENTSSSVSNVSPDKSDLNGWTVVEPLFKSPSLISSASLCSVMHSWDLTTRKWEGSVSWLSSNRRDIFLQLYIITEPYNSISHNRRCKLHLRTLHQDHSMSTETFYLPNINANSTQPFEARVDVDSNYGIIISIPGQQPFFLNHSIPLGNFPGHVEASGRGWVISINDVNNCQTAIASSCNTSVKNRSPVITDDDKDGFIHVSLDTNSRQDHASYAEDKSSDKKYSNFSSKDIYEANIKQLRDVLSISTIQAERLLEKNHGLVEYALAATLDSQGRSKSQSAASNRSSTSLVVPNSIHHKSVMKIEQKTSDFATSDKKLSTEMEKIPSGTSSINSKSSSCSRGRVYGIDTSSSAYAASRESSKFNVSRASNEVTACNQRPTSAQRSPHPLRQTQQRISEATKRCYKIKPQLNDPENQRTIQKIIESGYSEDDVVDVMFKHSKSHVSVEEICTQLNRFSFRYIRNPVIFGSPNLSPRSPGK